MNTVKRQLRTGFTGIEIILVLIVCVVIIGALAKSADQTASSGQKAVGPNDVSSTAQAVKETARAGTAVIRLSGAANDGDSAAEVPTVDPTSLDPQAGDGVGDILEDLVDAF
jgi:hypothetical protein